MLSLARLYIGFTMPDSAFLKIFIDSVPLNALRILYMLIALFIFHEGLILIAETLS